jgi:hypothetical protein
MVYHFNQSYDSFQNQMTDINDEVEDVIPVPAIVETKDDDGNDTTDYKALAEAQREIAEQNRGIAQRNKTRAERFKANNSKPVEAPVTQKPVSKSDILDLGAKAFLTSNGIKGSKEFEFVQAQMKQSGKDVESLLENGYFKTELENFRALAQTADATPTGKRSSGVATDSVEYWVAKAGPNAENLAEVPTDMRTKVVNALHAKAKDTGKFYNQ